MHEISMRDFATQAGLEARTCRKARAWLSAHSFLQMAACKRYFLPTCLLGAPSQPVLLTDAGGESVSPSNNYDGSSVGHCRRKNGIGESSAGHTHTKSGPYRTGKRHSAYCAPPDARKSGPLDTAVFIERSVDTKNRLPAYSERPCAYRNYAFYYWKKDTPPPTGILPIQSNKPRSRQCPRKLIQWRKCLPAKKGKYTILEGKANQPNRATRISISSAADENS